MAFYSAASNASLWKGINYYKNGKVVSLEHNDQNTIRGNVSGSADNIYTATIDLRHPKKSTCSCPFAEGRKVICKHMLALYFTGVPGSYELFEEDMRRMEVQYELEEERWRKETLSRIELQVSNLTEKQVREKLTDILYQQELDYRYRDNDYY